MGRPPRDQPYHPSLRQALLATSPPHEGDSWARRHVSAAPPGVESEFNPHAGVVKMEVAPSSSYIKLDSQHGPLGQTQAPREDPEKNRRRSPRGPSKRWPVGRLGNVIIRVRSRGDPSARTTFAQLQAATVHGGISTSEEQAGVERSQRDRDAIHYHAAEAVKAGNDAAAAKKGDIDLMVNVPPPLQGVRLAPDGSDGSRTGRSTSSRQSSALNGVSGNTNDGGDNRSRMSAPWAAIRSTRRKFWARRSVKTPEADKGGRAPSASSAADGLEQKVARMKRNILVESHARSGARTFDSNSAVEPDSRARARVKLIIEQPRVAEAYIRLGLQSNADMGTSRMIEMIDYYCK